MLEANKIDVLSGLRFILKCTNIYNKNGVHIKYNKNGDSIKIPDFLVFCVILFPTIYYNSLLFWAAIDAEFDFKAISTSLAGFVAGLHVASAYFSLTMTTDTLVSTFDRLQEYVEKSKFFY